MSSMPPIPIHERRPSRFAFAPRSLRSQIAIGFGAITVGVVVTLTLALGSMFAAKIEQDEAVDLRSVARIAARALAEGLTSRTREIEALAASPTLWLEGLSSPRVETTLARTQALTPYSAWIGVADVNGIVRASTGGLLVGVDVSERPWFQAGKSGTHVGDVHGAKLLAALLPAASDGGPQRFVDFSAPIRRDGRVVGILGMHGSWDWARSVVEGLVPEDADARRLDVSIRNRGGETIYRSKRSTAEPPRSADRAASAGAGSPAGGGDDALLATADVVAHEAASHLGWSVVVAEPIDVVHAEARASVRRSLALGGVAAAVACVLGWLFAERLTRPLRVIAATAKRVESGEPGVGFQRDAGCAEVEQLSLALGSMTRQLVRSNVELESRVRERTAALEAANAELDRQARVDPLTGLLNRRGMEQHFQQALASAKRRHAPLSVLVVDIDHFKRVNDTHGHDVGDAVLQSVAALLAGRARESDIVARIGGEEFVVVLADTDARSALAVADTLVRRVAGTDIEPVPGLTISCGVAQVRPGADTAQSVLKRADEALYRAKHEGRNHATFADTSFELVATP